MSIKNLLNGNEDIFVKHARKMELNERYGNKYLAAFLPGWFAYVNIRDDIRNPENNTSDKVISSAVALGCELVLDVERALAVYGLYEFAHYLKNHPLF